MSTSISRNTTALEELLETAENLPEFVTVQKKTGTFQTDSDGTAFVETGFIPDLIVVYGSTHNNVEWNMVYAYSEKISEYASMTCQVQHPSGIYMGQCTIDPAYGEAFHIWIQGFDWSWQGTPAANKEFNYTAVKYTA